MSDCGHGALIASGEARGLCPLCQRAEIERLRADKVELLKKRNSDEMQKMIDYWGQRAEKAEAEIERLRAALTAIRLQWEKGYAAPIGEIARRALEGK